MAGQDDYILHYRYDRDPIYPYRYQHNTYTEQLLQRLTTGPDPSFEAAQELFRDCLAHMATRLGQRPVTHEMNQEAVVICKAAAEMTESEQLNSYVPDLVLRP